MLSYAGILDYNLASGTNYSHKPRYHCNQLDAIFFKNWRIYLNKCDSFRDAVVILKVAGLYDVERSAHNGSYFQIRLHR